jgi:aminoglycoside/choline kinase family phosphotransferase
MKPDPITQIRKLLSSLGHIQPCTLTPLPSSGSDRQYYHIVFDGTVLPDLMAFYNPCVEENRAQLEFTRHFKNLGLSVPEVLATDSSETIFILPYLGNQTLFDMVSKGVSEEVIHYYKKALSDLVQFQINGVKGLNMDLAYPVPDFDRQSILWDLNYFKYCFLKPAGIAFNEHLLEKDFQHFADVLVRSKPDFFCYRDFQARNIMIYHDKPWYIDFQGGRRGPLPYDVVSLLHQVKANLPEDIKDSLYNHYISQLRLVAPQELEHVQHHYNHFVYFRLLQVMGAYGFRGLVERKAHFLQSIPFAAAAVKFRLKHHPLNISLPEIEQVLEQIIQQYSKIEIANTEKLTVNINSFSFKNKGLPIDLTGNGGGTVFDCRGLPNPHRVAALRDLTGEDLAISEYMRAQPITEVFLNHAFSLIDLSVENYLKRGFNHLQVNFGCTGGRHRSVYGAIQMHQHLQKKYPQVIVLLNHLEINRQKHD